MAAQGARTTRKDVSPEEKAKRKAERQEAQERTLRASSLRNAEQSIARARQALLAGDVGEHVKWLALGKSQLDAYDTLSAPSAPNGHGSAE